MPYFTKSDLVFTDYSWTALSGDNPKVSGVPDSTLLSRKEGYEILYFINKLAEIWQWDNSTKSGGKKIEKLIQLHLPSDIRSQLNVKLWLEQNWNNYN